MTEFTATHFRFEVQALTPLAFDEYTGSALRGALVGALQRNFCPARDQGDPAHQAICPVCWLLHYDATEGDSRRPYAIEPLLPGSVGRPARTGFLFEPGERFQFGLTLFGQTVNLFPYLVLAVPQIGAGGIGRKQPDEQGRWQRGRFNLCRIDEVNPLSSAGRADGRGRADGADAAAAGDSATGCQGRLLAGAAPDGKRRWSPYPLPDTDPHRQPEATGAYA